MILDSPIISGSSTVTGNLTVLGTLTANVSGSVTSASYATNAETLDGLDNTSFTTTSSFNTASGSFSTRITSNEGSITSLTQNVASLFATSASLNSRVNNLDSYTSSLNSKTGSFATTGSNRFLGTQTITGSLFITENLTVLGSSSISYVSQSTLNIGTNLITVNAQNPSIRFGGLAVIDSGSSPQVSGSYLFDSIQDRWIMIHQQTAGSALTSSIAIMGPETYNDLGNETTIALNRLVKGSSGASGEHIGNSNISDTGTVVSINSATQITGSLGVTGASTFASSMTSTLTSGIFLNNGSGGTNATQIRINNTGGDARMGVESSTGGTIQIGTSAYSAVFGNQANAATEFTTNGTVRMTILGGGNIGIGTASPSSFSAPANLLVVGTTSGNNGITIAAGSTGFSSIYFADGTTGNEAFRGYIEYGHSADALKFGTAAGDRMIITSTGNVGIGTTSPGGSLEVVGSGSVISRFNSTATNGGVISFQRSGTAILDIGTGLGLLGIGTNNDSAIYSTATMYLGANGTQFVTLRNGNVGIGTTTPTRGLSIFNNTIGLYSSSTGQGITDGYTMELAGTTAYLWNYENDSLIFGTNNTERMRITTAGRVGIGNTTPVSALVVSTTSNTSSIGQSGIVIEGASTLTAGDIMALAFTAIPGTTRARAAVGSIVGSDWGKGNLVFYTRDASDASALTTADERMRITSAGNVGIGTTDTQTFRLAVDGPNIGQGDTTTTIRVFDTTSATTGTGGGISFAGYFSGTSSIINTFSYIKGGKENSTAGDYASYLSFGTRVNGGSATERLRITSVGVLGFNGNSSPGNAGLDKMSMGYLNSNYGWIQTWNGTPLILNREGNNVGINTSTPFSSLDVATSSTGAICVGNSSTGISSGDLIGAISFVSRDASTYSSGGVSNIRSYATETYNSSNVGADLRFYTTNGVQNINADILFGTERMRITNAGNLDFNRVNATAYVNINLATGADGGIIFLRNNNNRWQVAPTPPSDNLLFYSYGISSPALTLAYSTGNVGIGTTSPSEKLDVNGTIKATQLSLGDSYNTVVTTNSSWSSFQTIIPGNTLEVFSVYLITASYSVNDQPYNVTTSFTFVVPNCNGGGGDNEFTPICATHTGGTGTMSFRAVAVGGQLAGGLQVKFNGFATLTGSLTLRATILKRGIN
jgi:hypothetical protein